MVERDHKDGDDLRALLAMRDAAPDENARKRAVNLALAAFDAGVAEKNNKITQGNGLWGRLTGRTNLNGRRNHMNKKFLYGGMATAMVVVMAAGLSMQMIGDVRTSTIQESAAPLADQPFANIAQNAGETNILPRAAQESPVAEIAQDPLDRWRRLQPERVRKEMPADMALAEVQSAIAPAPAMGGAAVEGLAGRRSMAYAPTAHMVMPYPAPDGDVGYYQEQGRDKFETVTDNPVKTVKTDPVSTFSVDVDTASYSVVRRSLNNGVLPPADAVRIEEMVNYFDYDYAVPADKAQPFKPRVTVVPSPWAAGRKLVHIGIKGYDIADGAKPRSNLVFLIDVSGSMNAPDKLPLLKSSMKMLLESLEPEDTVAIVTYAGNAGTALEPTKVADKAKIVAVIDGLGAGGGTAGAEGLEQAYRLAEAQKAKLGDEKAVSRVILASDGDFNIGRSSVEEMKNLIAAKRKSGVFLSVLGFGMGNLNDHLMQALAQNGNGTAAYIDNLNEARKVLVEEAAATLFPIAKDVKIQVDFNPATVAEYRLIGYETRALNREDFNNDAVDAGDIGAGHTVTALYEITPVGGPVMVDPSRYETTATVTATQADTAFGNEYAFLKIRYKLPDGEVSQLITAPVTFADEKTPDSDVNWAVAVAGFGQILKGGQYMTGFGYDEVIDLAQKARGDDPYGYRAEFINMVRLAKTLTP